MDQQEHALNSLKQYRQAQQRHIKQSSWFWQGRDLLTGQAIVSSPNGELLQAQIATNAGLARGQVVAGNSNPQQLAINARNAPRKRPSPTTLPLAKPRLPTRKVIFVAFISQGISQDDVINLAVIGISPEPELIANNIDLGTSFFIRSTIKIDFLNDNQNWEVTYWDGQNYRYINSLGENVSIPYNQPIFTISGAWAISDNDSFFRGQKSNKPNITEQGFFIGTYPRSPTSEKTLDIPFNQMEPRLMALPVLVSPRHQLVSEIYSVYRSSDPRINFFSSVNTPNNLPYLRLKRRNSNIGGELSDIGYLKLRLTEDETKFAGIEDDFIKPSQHPFCGSQNESCRGTNYQVILSTNTLTVEADLVYTRSTPVPSTRLSTFSPFPISVLDNTLSLPIQIDRLRLTGNHELRLALGYHELYTAIVFVLRNVASTFNSYSWYSGTTRLTNHKIRLTYNPTDETMVIVITGTLIDDNYSPVTVDPLEGSIDLSSIMPTPYPSPTTDLEYRYNDYIVLLNTVLGSTVNYSGNYGYENLMLFITCDDPSNIIKELYLSITEERFMPPDYYPWLDTRKTLGFFTEGEMFFPSIEVDRGSDEQDVDDDIINTFLTIDFQLVYEDGEPIFANSITGVIDSSNLGVNPFFSYILTNTSIAYSADGTGKITLTFPLKTIDNLNTKVLVNEFWEFLEPEKYDIKSDVIALLRSIIDANNDMDDKEQLLEFLEIYQTLPVPERLYLNRRYRLLTGFNPMLPPPEYQDYINNYDIPPENWSTHVESMLTTAGVFLNPLGIMPISNMFCIRIQVHLYPSFKDIRSKYNDYKSKTRFFCKFINEYHQLAYTGSIEDTLPLLKPSYTYKTVWDGSNRTAWLSWVSSFGENVQTAPDSLNTAGYSLLNQQLASISIGYDPSQDIISVNGSVVFVQALEDFDIAISDVQDMFSRVRFYSDNYTFAEYGNFTATSNPDIRRTTDVPRVPTPNTVFGGKHALDQDLSNQMLISTSNSQSFFDRELDIFGRKQEYIYTPKGGLLYPVFPTNVSVEFETKDIQIVIFMAESQGNAVLYSIELSEPISLNWSDQLTVIRVLDGTIDLF